MPAAEFVRGRVLGRTEALILYCDPTLSDSARGQRLVAIADSLDGDELTGFWRGANEIRPESVTDEIRAHVRAGDFDELEHDAGVGADRSPISPARIVVAATLGVIVAVALLLVVRALF